MNTECKKCIHKEKKNNDWVCREVVKKSPMFDFVYLKFKTFDGCKFFNAE